MTPSLEPREIMKEETRNSSNRGTKGAAFIVNPILDHTLFSSQEPETSPLQRSNADSVSIPGESEPASVFPLTDTHASSSSETATLST
ncbi:hypothetical protein V6N12_027890 [Hibiscus sabdariffa]|uniref:Uncharacterized protein n=1 Tax=Hibiscus sabdariffa TaxID=183260 RepID=A0ABR2F483_9ROSI